MSEVNEEFSRLFFEQCNFLVRTNVKYYIIGEGNVGGDSDIDLVVYNLSTDRQHPPNNFVLNVNDLRGIEYAIAETKGWHQERFSPAVINNNPRIFNFVREESIAKATEVLNTAHFKKILIISSLPANENTRNDSINLLQQAGIDHVLEFKTIIDKLLNDVEPNKNYHSHILQTIRLIRKYSQNIQQ